MKMYRPSPLEKRIAKIQFGTKARKEFYTQMISLMRAGVSMTDALRMIWDISSKEGKKPKEAIPLIIADMIAALKEGRTFARALAPWIPRDELMVIEAIEDSTDFPGNLENYLDLSERKRSIRSTILGGLFYPVFLMTIVFGLIFYFGRNAIPQIAQVYPVERWTGPALALRWMAWIAETIIIPAVGVLIVSLILVVFSLPRWSGFGRRIADRFPLYSTYRLYSGISFLTSVSALASSGIPIVSAIQKLKASANPYVRDRLNRVHRNMLDGQNFGSALYRTGTGWPDDRMSLAIKIFAETQDLSAQLSRLSRDWLVESQRSIEQNMSTLRYVSMIAMFLVIVTIIGGIYTLNIQISQQNTF